MHVGTVAELWHYPVKSLQGIRSAQISVDEVGVVGDRQFALLDIDSNSVITGKRVAQLLQAQTIRDGQTVNVVLPSGQEIDLASINASEQISQWLQRTIRVVRNDSLDIDLREVTAARGGPVFKEPTAGVPFYDSRNLHLLSYSSLRQAEQEQPGVEWDVRRFRPNIVVDTGSSSGFVEESWIGCTLQIDELVCQVEKRTERCALPTRPQPAVGDRLPLPASPDLGRYLKQNLDNCLGVYARVIRPGSINEGAQVVLT